MKKICCLLLSALLLGCTACGGPQKYSADTFAFDTVINLTAYCDSEAQFQALRKVVFDRLQQLHKQFDAYNTYEGVNNLCTVNQSGGRPITVEEDLLELLQFGQDIYEQTDGRVNIAKGELFGLWREARETGLLPDDEAVRAAQARGSMEDLLLDEQNRTVTLLDPQMTLDVGAIGKGWAAEAAARAAAEAGYTDFALSAGGNVVVRGQTVDRPWKVGIRDPRSADSTAYAAAIDATDTAVVTSGGYERNLVVDGKTYCHIIDAETGYPVDNMLSVTVICEDSGLADGLSTALFLMEPQEALTFAKEQGVRAIVIDREGDLWDTQTIEE